MVNGVFRAVRYFQDIRTFYAVGDSGAIYRRFNGLNWQVVTNTVFPDAALYDVAYDPASEQVFIVGDDAGAPVAMSLYEDALNDITADVGITEGIQRVMNEDGIAIRVTMSYDHDYLGAKFTLDTLYGVAEMRDSHGVAVSTDEI